MEGYDLASIRGLYSSLADGWTYLNAHQRAQVPQLVAQRMAIAFRRSPLVTYEKQEESDIRMGSHVRTPHPGELYAESYDASARRAIADLVGGDAECVLLAPNKELLMQALAASMHRRLGAGSFLLASKGDPEWLTRPFARVADAVRWVQPDIGSALTPAQEYKKFMDGAVRLALATAADHHIGTVGEIAALCDIVHSARAWILIDASAYAPYRPIDMDVWDADIVIVDIGALGGPGVVAAIFRAEEMFPRLGLKNAREFEETYFLAGSVDAALLGGVAPIIDHYAGLARYARGSRRRRIAYSMGLLAEHFEEIMSYCVDSLMNVDGVHIVGISEENGDLYADHIARVSFILLGVPAETVYQRLLSHGILTTLTPTTRLTRAMGVEEAGGAISISFSPFNTTADVDNLVRAITSLI